MGWTLRFRRLSLAPLLACVLGTASPLPASAQVDCQLNAPCNLCRAACYSVRSVEKIERGSIVEGTFDRPYLRNRCQNGRDESGKTFTAYIPAGSHRELKVLVSIHGTWGDSDDYLTRVIDNDCHTKFPNVCPKATPYNRAFFDRHGIIVLAPQFLFFSRSCEQDRFDNFIQDRGHRSDQWLIALVDFVAASVGKSLGTRVKHDQIYLFGQSRGGQFVNKFVYAHPERVIRAAAANSGNYVYPEYRVSVFSDLRAKGLTPQGAPERLRRALTTAPLAIVNGTRDDKFNRLGADFVCNPDVQRVCPLEPAFECRGRPGAGGAQPTSAFIPGEPLHYRSAQCKLEYFWVDKAIHHGAQAYPTAAEFLFRGME